MLRLMDRVEHVPTSIILQFVTTFGVWLLAERLGLSAVLTMVCFAVTVARISPARTPARTRIPTYAVWETVVFALNILAFIFIGLQMRPILDGLEAARPRALSRGGRRRAGHRRSSCASPGTCRSTPSSGGVIAGRVQSAAARCCGPPSAAA